MIINAMYDSSVEKLPSSPKGNTPSKAQFVGAVKAAIGYFEHVFSNNVAITIHFGWGEVEGKKIPGGDIAANYRNYVNVSYAQVYDALKSHQTSTDAATAFKTLPPRDPTNGGTFYVPYAEAVVLGLTPRPTLAGGIASGIGAEVAGYVGLGKYSFTWDPNHRAVAGKYDAIGTLEHEISEVMGRVGKLGQNGEYTPLDLFRYNSGYDPYTSQHFTYRNFSPGQGFFSIDGKDLLTKYNDAAVMGSAGTGRDWADWAPTDQGGSKGDSFGFNDTGVAQLVTPTDLREMNVLGWNLSPEIAHEDPQTRSRKRSRVRYGLLRPRCITRPTG